MYDFINKSIKNRIVVSSVALILIITIFASIYYPLNQKNQISEQAKKQFVTLAEMLAFSVGLGLKDANFELVQTAFEWAKKDNNVSYLAIYDESNNLLAASVTDDTTRQRNRNKKQKKQTILTGYKRTGNDIHNGQRVSRHSLPTLLYFLFSPPHIFFNSILCQRTNGTLAFAPTAQANPQAKAKEPFFANAPMRLLKII